MYDEDLHPREIRDALDAILVRDERCSSDSFQRELFGSLGHDGLRARRGSAPSLFASHGMHESAQFVSPIGHGITSRSDARER